MPYKGVHVRWAESLGWANLELGLGFSEDWGNPFCLCLPSDEAGRRRTGQPLIWNLPHDSWLIPSSPQTPASAPLQKTPVPIPHPSSLAPSHHPLSLPIPPCPQPSIPFPTLSFEQIYFFLFLFLTYVEKKQKRKKKKPHLSAFPKASKHCGLRPIVG